MIWDAIGAFAELLGAVGVIASLVYLATQIRQSREQMSQNTRAMRAIMKGHGEDMTLAKQILVRVVSAALVVGAPLAASQAQTADSPEVRLQMWQAALERGDYPAYVECLHTGTREIPEYGSEEAMDFWANEMGDLRRMGFTGRFEIAVVTEGGPRFPPGSVRAYPIVNGQPIREAIVLFQEAGDWKILRLFS